MHESFTQQEMMQGLLPAVAEYADFVHDTCFCDNSKQFACMQRMQLAQTLAGQQLLWVGSIDLAQLHSLSQPDSVIESPKEHMPSEAPYRTSKHLYASAPLDTMKI